MAEYFTKEGLKKLRDELEYLKTTKTKEIAELLKYAASFGDLKENAGYHDAKDRQAFLLGRIEELENIVHNAVIYEKKAGDEIQVGSSVVLLLDGKEEKMELVAPGESDILKNKISYESPLGQKLIGQKVGKTFTLKTGSENLEVKVLKVD